MLKIFSPNTKQIFLGWLSARLYLRYSRADIGGAHQSNWKASMARPAANGNMTIAQLENLLNSRRSRLNELMRDQKRAQQKLDTINRQIASLSGRAGAGSTGGGSRVRNSTSLVQTMQNILKDSGKALSVSEILSGVLKSG